MPLAVLATLIAVLLLAPARAAAHPDCGTAWACPFSDVLRFGGPAPTKVHDPADLAVAPDGRLAVADFGADRVLVLAADGTPAKVLDAGEPRVRASSVAFDAQGRLYTAGDGHLRRYGTNYELQRDVTAGLLRGDPGNQHYAAVRALAVDGDGRVYALADEVILVYGPDGVLERELRRPDGGDFARDGALVAEGSGRVLVGNVEIGRVEELRPDGSASATITELPEGARLGELALDDSGRLHVPGTREIWVYDRSGARAGSTPHELAANEGALAVTRAGYVLAAPDRLVRFDAAGGPLPPWGADPGHGLSRPTSVSITGTGRAVVASGDDHRVVAYAPDGHFEGVVVERPGDRPLSVAAGPGDEVLVAWESGRLERRGPAGDLRSEWRVSGTPLLTGASYDPDGTVWVRDRSDMLHFTSAGTLLARIAAGLQSTWGAGNGLDVGPDGNLYAAEPSRIVKLSPTGAVLGGFEAQLAEGVEVLADGRIAVATQRDVQLLGADGRHLEHWGDFDPGRLRLPWDVAVDETGRFHVVDRSGHSVVRYAPKPPEPEAPAAPAGRPQGPLVEVARFGRTLRANRSGWFRVGVSCGAEAACDGEIKLRRRGGRSGRALARRPFELGASASTMVRVRLRAPARRALRRDRRLRAWLDVRPAGGWGVRRRVVVTRRFR